MSNGIPRWFYQLGVIAVVASLIPLAAVAYLRAKPAAKPRMHLVQDMDNAISFKRQEPNALFADGRSMRAPIEGTVARGMLQENGAYYQGIDGDDWVAAFPFELTMERLERGRDRYDIYCTPCHGLAGTGDGTVARRASERLEALWVPPTSLHDELVVSRAPGHLFNTITHGLRTMPAYGPMIPTDDRWAIVAYIRALQRSQNADIDDVTPDDRARLSQ